MVEQIDSMKRKQFAKGVTEIAQVGAIQIFFEPGTGMERVVVGVVGVLQFDVLQFRMESEYGCATTSATCRISSFATSTTPTSTLRS